MAPPLFASCFWTCNRGAEYWGVGDRLSGRDLQEVFFVQNRGFRKHDCTGLSVHLAAQVTARKLLCWVVPSALSEIAAGPGRDGSSEFSDRGPSPERSLCNNVWAPQSVGQTLLNLFF